MTKKNLILAVILMLLVAAAYVYRGPYQNWRAKAGQPKNFLASVKIDQLSKIEIQRNNATTTLEKTGDKWKINGTKDFYVESGSAQNMIDQLRAAVGAPLVLVSENKDKKISFQTDDSGAKVKLYQSGYAAASFIVGKMASDFQSTYISEINTDKTYSVKASLNLIFDRPDWYDRTIFTGDVSKITKIRMQYPKTEFTLEKKSDKWAGTKPNAFSVNQDKASAIANLMANLSATEIPEQKFAGTGLDKSSVIVQATGEGIDNTIMIGGIDKTGRYFVKKGLSDNIYLITKEQKATLDTTIAKLK